MCGRFTLRTPTGELVEQFRLGLAPQLEPRFNIAPTQRVSTVRIAPEDGQRFLSLMRWGLIPAWSKDPSIGARMINARAETVAEKPAFRAAFKRRRCLVPADGYYEWKKAGSRKLPHYIRMRDDRPFAFAGLWETWQAADGAEDPIETCTIITTEANELSRPIHDRMPVILGPADFDLWLDPKVLDREKLESLLRPFASAAMIAHRVTTHVNNVRHDDPACVAAADD